MAYSSLTAEAQALAASVTETLGDGPLALIGQRLVQLLEGVTCALEAGHPERLLVTAIDSVRHTIKQIPATFGDRFYLDAQLIQSILDQWSGGKVAFSRFVIPHYISEWGYYRVPMPSENRESAHVVCVTGFPGADRLDAVDLAEYAWLLHELAHDGFYRVDDQFRAPVAQCLRKRLRSLRLRTSADSGAARQRSLELVDALEAFWSPRGNQMDWSHEIAVDVAAFFVLGPAYTSCFRRLLTRRNVGLDVVTPQHPSYRIRAHALITVAEQLAWSDEAFGLQEALAARTASAGTRSLVYADPEILQGVVDASLHTCDALDLPRMTTDRMAAMLRRADDDESPSAVDVIVRASIQKQRLAPGDYATWHRETVQRMT